MNPAQVKATIGQGNAAVDDSAVYLHAVRDRTERALTLAVATCGDSTHDQVTAGLANLRAALKESSQVIDLLDVSAQAAGKYAAKLG